MCVPVDASAGEALQLSIDACLTHLRPNESGWLEREHADFLHQTRVSTRRLRALLSLTRRLVRDDPAAMDLKTRLRAILVPLGPARDLDVALARARADQWADADLSRLETARTEAYVGVRSVLTSPAWQRIWEDLEQWRQSPAWLAHVAGWRDGPARAVTDEALDRRFRRIVEAGPMLMTMSDHDLHRVRIEAKKLRYGCQFFDTLYPGADIQADASVTARAGEAGAGPALSVPLQVAETAAGMQDAFGLFNDYAVADALRAELGLQTPVADERASRADCVYAWEQMVAVTPFWRLP